MLKTICVKAENRSSLSIISSFDVLGIDPCLNAHRLQLLQQEFRGVRNLNLADLCRATHAHRASALVRHLLQVRMRRQTAPLTDVNAILIRIHKEAIAHKVGTTVRDQTITFHLSHPQSSIARATFQRLPCQHCHWTTSARVHFVIHCDWHRERGNSWGENAMD